MDLITSQYGLKIANPVTQVLFNFHPQRKPSRNVHSNVISAEELAAMPENYSGNKANKED